MGRTAVVVKALKSIVSNGLALLGAWALLEIVKRLIEARAPAPVDWGLSANAQLGRDIPPVGELIGRNLGPTLELLAVAMLLAMVLVGLQIALFRRSSRAGSGGALRPFRSVWLSLWTAAPAWYLYFLMLLIFATWLHVLPSGGLLRQGPGCSRTCAT